MRKLLLAFVGCVVAVSLASADNLTVKAPVTDRGVAANPLHAGFAYKYLSSTTETLICSKNCLLLDFIMSSGTTSMYIKVRDTLLADGLSTAQALPWLSFSQYESSARGPRLGYPIRASYGWVVQLVGTGNENTVSVVYLTY